MGEIYALAAAVFWAFAVILFKKSGEAVPPLALNLFRVTATLPLFLITLIVARQPLLPALPVTDYLILVASGIIGIAIADTLFHASLNRIGAGITAIVDCLYSPLVVLLAWLTLGERFGACQLGGMVIVITGVLVASRLRPPPETDTRTLLIGIAIGAAGMLALAVGIVIAKPVLNRTPVVWATAVRQVGCLLVLAPVVLLSRRRREILAVFVPGRTWKFTLTGSVLGSFLAVTVWIAGMKYTQAGTAAILNQTTTIYILLLASLFLKESFTARKGLAAVLAVAGILMVTLG